MAKKKEPVQQERVTLHFTTGVCAPARETVATMLKSYKPKNMVVRSENKKDADGNIWQDVEIDVNKQAAGWIEYLVLSSHRFVPNGKLFNPKNEEYAARRSDMPKAWIESGCSKAEAFKDYKPKKARESTKSKKKRKGSVVKTAKSILDFLS